MADSSATTGGESDQVNQGNVICIWFELTMNTSADIEKTKEDLRLTNNCVFSHNNNIDSCVTAMKTIESKKKIFLIISDNDASELLSPSVHNLHQLDSIFIFPGRQDKYNHLFDKFDKIVNIFDKSDELLTSIKENLTDVKNQLETFSFYNQNGQATRDLSEESAKFLWFQLFNDVILHLPRDDQSKEEMINTCRQYYRDNRKVIKQIEDFRQNYKNTECIFWYTRDIFLYRLINKALRTEDIDQLYTFRYYIADLSTRLDHEYRKYQDKMTNEFKKTIKLYRGAIISTEEAKKLQDNDGKLIATNGYWSTSHKRSVASIYIDGHLNDNDTTAVLFEIECDLRDEKNSIIFADITGLSQMPDEEEVLFDIGAVFQIEKIEGTDGLVIQIRTTGEGREIAEKYKEENRLKMKDESPTIMLCTLLKRMGKVDKSLQFLEKLLENPGNENLALFIMESVLLLGPKTNMHAL